MARGDEIGAQGVDGGGFADAWHAGDADAQGRTGEGHERLHQSPRLGLMLGLAAFDQGDGAGERRPVARAQPLGEGRHVDGSGEGRRCAVMPPYKRARAAMKEVEKT